MINLKAFLGNPIDFEGICFIYPPKVKDIIGLENYNIYQKMLTISQEEIQDSFNKTMIEDEAPHIISPLDIDENNVKPLSFKKPEQKIPTPLEYILNNCYHDKKFLELLQDAFMLFTNSEILPLYDNKAIYIGDVSKINEYNIKDKLPILNESNFFEFQNLIRELTGQEKIDKMDLNEDPRIARMKAKARYRDKIKAKNGEAIIFENIIVAICCMNLGITPLNIGEMSYSAIATIFRMYQNKEKYDLDTSCLLAGADSKKIKPKYWITNLN